MIGMDRHTGASLSGVEHLRQSIADILTTPLGSRRMRPAYGCQLRRFVGRSRPRAQPLGAAFQAAGGAGNGGTQWRDQL